MMNLKRYPKFAKGHLCWKIIFMASMPIFMGCLKLTSLDEKEILDTLDHSTDSGYNTFIDLGNTYSYLIDSRLNIFADDDNHWAIAAERLGYNPRGGVICLEIIYFGNCLSNLEIDGDKTSNYYSVYPIEQNSFVNTVGDEENLIEEAEYWVVRNEKVKLVHDKQVYENAGIKSRAWDSVHIAIEDAGRLLIQTHASLFRATDQELYKSIPKKMKKILVVDEWNHKDFAMLKNTQDFSEEQLKQIYEFNNRYSKRDDSFESYVAAHKKQLKREQEYLKKMWDSNRPSSYETWNMIAKVIVTKDPKNYKPTLKPNSNWRNWPESGSL